MKTEIINLLQTTQAFNGGNQGINARDVHRLLKVGRMYQHWIKARIKQAGFIENQDFVIVQNSTIGLPKLASKNTVHFLRDKMGEQKKAVRRNNLTARQLEKFPKDTFMKKIHVYSSIDENFNKPQALQSAVNFGMILLQSQKTIVSRGKLNLLQAHSTPKACFFMRNIRTSQELADFVLFNLMILSMVGRNRQPLAVGCLPVMAVFHPVTSYRPTVESLAVVSENLLQETTQMYQFIFAAIRRTDLTNHIVKIRINADTEQEARKPLAREFVLVLAGRINLQNTVKTDRTLPATTSLSELPPAVDVKAESVKIHTLPKVQNVSSIESTETIHGTRNRNQCAIFLPKIPFNGYEPAGYTYHSELAVRATRGNKALSTNNAGYCMVAVDPLPHPTTVGKFYSLTRDHTMKIYPQNNRTLATFPALSVSAEMEVVHA